MLYEPEDRGLREGKPKAKMGRKKPATSTIDRENTEQQSETEHGRGESDEDQKKGRWLRE